MTQLDAQVQAFVDQSMSYYPADAVGAEVTQQRQWYNALCLALAAPRPDTVVIKDDNVQGVDGYLIPVRHYQAKPLSDNAELLSNLQVVYFHGGGFVVGGLDSHDDVCAELADFCGFNLVSVDYRLAPEYQYPCDINDCLAVVDHLLDQGKKLILVGDSAGGTLAACVANARSNYSGKQLLGQVLIYPALAGGIQTRSTQEHAYAPLLTQADLVFYHAIRVGGNESKVPKQDPYFCPMQTQSFAALPPTFLFPAQIDPLHDDCERYEQALRAAGVEVQNNTNIGIGLVHGYLRARHTSSKAAANFKAICTAVKDLGQ
tara:strand:- start:2412 stop:3362 length:951 start_codon:yes stop_codon:yes gene_type:complete